MSEDKQDNKHTDNKRSAKKEGGRLGGLLLVVILIGAGVAAWYYQAMWLPQAQQWWATLMPAQEEADHMAAPEPRGAETEESAAESESSGYVLSAITDEKPAEETTQDAVAEVPAAADPVSVETSAVQVDEPVAPAVASTDDTAKDVVMDETPAISSSDAKAATVETEQDTSAVIPMAPRIQETTTTTTVTIELARQAFWARDLVKAEAMYRELLKQEPAAADAWGELGNLYYGQAKWQQAAAAYAEAAIQLLEQEQYSQAMFLHYVVQSLDPAQAARIETKVHAMQATPQG